MISYYVENLHTELNHTHSTVLWRGLYLCQQCGTTGSHRLIKLSTPRTRPTKHGELNLRAYTDGTKPVGFPNCPCKRIHIKSIKYIRPMHTNMEILCPHQVQMITYQKNKPKIRLWDLQNRALIKT